MNHVQRLREYVELIYETALYPEDAELLGRMKVIKEYFLDIQAPMKFNPYVKDNVSNTWEKNFENVCSALEDNGVSDPKKLTEYEFLSRLQYYEEKYKKMEEAHKKHN